MSSLNIIIWVYVLVCVFLFLPRVCTVTLLLHLKIKQCMPVLRNTCFITQINQYNCVFKRFSCWLNHLNVNEMWSHATWQNVSLGIFAHSSSSFVILQSLFQLAFDGVEVRDLFGLVKFFHTILIQPYLYGLCFHAGFWNRKGPSPNCSLKVESIALSRIYLYAEALRFPFTGS